MCDIVVENKFYEFWRSNSFDTNDSLNYDAQQICLMKHIHNIA